MKRPKGPELKMPELKVPGFLADFYYDLRDRRLLPVIGLVLVAIVATPILLGQKSETTPPPEAAGAFQALKESSGQRASLTVVEANPGLRDYRKRLRGRKPLDPFRSMGKPSLKGAQLGNGKEGAEGSSSGSSFTSTSATVKKTKTQESSTTTETTDTTHSTETTNPGGSSGPHLTFYAFAIDVRIVKTVDGEQQEPIVERRVLSQTPLPGEKTPVVTFMGPARDGGKATGNALLLVNNDVRTVEGDAKCLSGDAVCQLLEVEPGFPVVLTYGENEARYAITVLKLAPIVVGHS